MLVKAGMIDGERRCREACQEYADMMSTEHGPAAKRRRAKRKSVKVIHGKRKLDEDGNGDGEGSW